METEILSLRDESAQCKVRATVDGRLTTQAEQTFVFDPEGLADDDDARAARPTRE